MSQLSHKIYVDISLLSIPRAGRRRPDINMAMLRLSICQFVTPPGNLATSRNHPSIPRRELGLD